MKIIIKISIACICLTSFSCKTTQIKKNLTGVWVVESFELDNKEWVFNGLIVNMVNFEENGICELPVRDLSISDTANWEIKEFNSVYYLSIKNSKDHIFNANFQIELSTEKRNIGNIRIVYLRSPNLLWKLTRR